ncbi:MAG: hypothetical protein KDD61_07715 [Bdellovibrionales bacterium]|nr:hypothetical protein [Bdellovibrionales bacterium]
MIGLLDAYDPEKNREPYHSEYTKLAVDGLKNLTDSSRVQVYKVAQGQMPKNGSECRLWVISGSPASVYEELPWIHQLRNFVIELDSHKYPLLGLCFGHQMIASALGGKVEKSSKGWGVGTRSFPIVQQKLWMNPSATEIRLIYSHQDQVVRLPKESDCLGTSPFCEYEMYCKGSHILSMQGHPEFSKAFAESRLESRKSHMPQDIYQTGLETLKESNDSRLIWTWISNWLNESK